jgi:hypothetical protein
MNTITEERTTTVIEYVPIASITSAPFNPSTRTELRVMKKMVESIKSVGILVPLIITKDNELADGHRRLTAAKMLEYESVPVIRIDMDLGTLWSECNKPIMAPVSRTWMEAVGLGLEVENVPQKIREQIVELKRVVGTRTFNRLVENHRSTHILTMAKSVARYCGDETDGFLKKVIIWFEDCQQQFAVRRAMAENCPPEIINNSVMSGRPIRQYWGMA